MNEINELKRIISLLEDYVVETELDIVRLQNEINERVRRLDHIKDDLEYNKNRLNELIIDEEIKNMNITLDEFIENHTFRITTSREAVEDEYGSKAICEIEVEGKTYIIFNAI